MTDPKRKIPYLKLNPTHLAQEFSSLKGGKNWERKLKTLLLQNEVVTF